VDLVALGADQDGEVTQAFGVEQLGVDPLKPDVP
jgi:hypothetical protein